MKTIKLLGHEIEVRSDEECEKAEMCVCVRVGQLSPESAAKMAPHQVPGAACSRCGHAVHRDIRGPKTPPSVCMECLNDETAGVQSVAE
jgi:hypothetical protein